MHVAMFSDSVHSLYNLCQQDRVNNGNPQFPYKVNYFSSHAFHSLIPLSSLANDLLLRCKARMGPSGGGGGGSSVGGGFMNVDGSSFNSERSRISPGSVEELLCMHMCMNTFS